MGIRRNGKDLAWQEALEQGLSRISKAPKTRTRQAEFAFGLVRRLYKAAPFVTSRDDEMARVVLKDLVFSRAAAELSPGNPESMRSRISARFSFFKRLAEFFLSEAHEAPFRRRVPRTRRKRSHSRTILRGPKGHLDAVRPEFGVPSGHTCPMCGGTSKGRVRAPMAMAEGV